MTKFFVAATFAAVAFAVTPAAACDWNREASARASVVATAAAPTEQTVSQAAANPSQPANVAEEAGAHQRASEPTAPVVLVTDRH